jgi:hypothetical protein
MTDKKVIIELVESEAVEIAKKLAEIKGKIDKAVKKTRKT